MTDAINNLQRAQERAMAARPTVGGFPLLAEVLRQSGVRKNEWWLPSAQSLYLTETGPVMQQAEPLQTGTLDVPPFDQKALISALRADQAGQTSLPEFLMATWEAGVVHYIVDLDAHSVTYYGADGGNYVESYPAVTVNRAQA